MDMNLSKLWETVKDRGAWCATIHEVAKSWAQFSSWMTTIVYFPPNSPSCLSLCLWGQTKKLCSDVCFWQIWVHQAGVSGLHSENWASLILYHCVHLEYNSWAREIPWRKGTPTQYSCLENSVEEPGRLQSMELQGVGHNWATNTDTVKTLYVIH